MPDKLKKLEDILKILEGGVNEEEFIKSLEKILIFVKMLEKDQKEITQYLTDFAEKTVENIKKDSENNVGKIKAELSGDFIKLLTKIDDRENKIDNKLASIKDGKDADETKIVQEILSKIKLPKPQEPEKPEEIRDKLETLQGENKLSIQAIQSLPAILEELKSRPSGRSGPSLISRRIRFIDDETPTGTVNGVNAVFTISKTPETGSLKVYVNGARMRVTEDYTVSNKTITFNTAPPTGSILLADYRY